MGLFVSNNLSPVHALQCPSTAEWVIATMPMACTVICCTGVCVSHRAGPHWVPLAVGDNSHQSTNRLEPERQRNLVKVKLKEKLLQKDPFYELKSYKKRKMKVCLTND